MSQRFLHAKNLYGYMTVSNTEILLFADGFNISLQGGSSVISPKGDLFKRPVEGQPALSLTFSTFTNEPQLYAFLVEQKLLYNDVNITFFYRDIGEQLTGELEEFVYFKVNGIIDSISQSPSTGSYAKINMAIAVADYYSNSLQRFIRDGFLGML